MSTLRQQRAELRVHGLAGFLGRVTGVSTIRRAVHRYRDRKILEEQKIQRVALQAKQLAEKKDLAERQALQSRTLDGKLRSLKKVEDRELAALKRDGLKNQCVQERDGFEAMPPFDIARSKVADKPLRPEFEAAKARGAQPPPDPAQDFNRAASAQESERSDDGGRAKPREMARNGNDSRYFLTFADLKSGKVSFSLKVNVDFANLLVSEIRES
jgi:hypothetical protein